MIIQKPSSSKIIDISPIVSSETAVWPGDVNLTRNVLCDIKKGSNIELSALTSTVHIGAHADASYHYHISGKTIENMDLEPYIGPCQVVSVIGKKLIEVKDCEFITTSRSNRVLFRTLSQKDYKVFNTNFTAISPDAVEFLGKAGVKLIGIDTASVDPFDSKDLQAHQILLKYNIANVEGLNLEHVQDGTYEFIGLPLKLEGFDASPIRAILRVIS